MPRVNYTHVTLECIDCLPVALNDTNVVRNTLRLAAATCHLNILKEDLYAFQPQGITGYLLLSESHISIHTWPEEQFALIDVMSCAQLNVEALLQCIRETLRPSRMSTSCQFHTDKK